MLNKDQLLGFAPSTKVVETEAGPVTLKEMNGKQREAYDTLMLKAHKSGDLSGLKSSLVSTCLREPSLTEAEAGELPASILERLFEAAQELNGIGADAEDAAEGN